MCKKILYIRNLCNRIFLTKKIVFHRIIEYYWHANITELSIRDHYKRVFQNKILEKCDEFWVKNVSYFLLIEINRFLLNES